MDATNTKKQIGQRIAHLRRARGYTQESLSQKAKLSGKYLSRVETGRENPTVETLVKLARGLEVELEEILPTRRRADKHNDLRTKATVLLGQLGRDDLRALVRILEAIVRG